MENLTPEQANIMSLCADKEIISKPINVTPNSSEHHLCQSLENRGLMFQTNKSHWKAGLYYDLSSAGIAELKAYWNNTDGPSPSNPGQMAHAVDGLADVVKKLYYDMVGWMDSTKLLASENKEFDIIISGLRHTIDKMYVKNKSLESSLDTAKNKLTLELTPREIAKLASAAVFRILRGMTDADAASEYMNHIMKAPVIVGPMSIPETRPLDTVTACKVHPFYENDERSWPKEDDK